ncbi:hypothetical protein HPB52_015563 [Rhipicephalus sanguineus]|uniref:Uncharacterized protein n=1 Tax=Rhipicephalus sanguineus TaxID=34632 RepID=A0A9D4PFR1_RHISA|nr:hypothetical protein HPB52_015563 [Rhipicephalus sanguineus]
MYSMPSKVVGPCPLLTQFLSMRRITPKQTRCMYSVGKHITISKLNGRNDSSSEQEELSEALVPTSCTASICEPVCHSLAPAAEVRQQVVAEEQRPCRNRKWSSSAKPQATCRRSRKSWEQVLLVAGCGP